MSFPSDVPGGYPGQPVSGPGAGYGPPAHSERSVGGLGPVDLLALGVAVLALVSYFCGFSSDAVGAGIQVMILLAGGLIAVFQVIPKAPKSLPVAAVLSLVGGLSMLALIIQSSGATTIAVVILIMGLLQAGLAVAALLLDYEVIKLAPRAPARYGPHGGFPSPGPYAPPVAPNPYGQQFSERSTQFLQHPGQVSQQQPSTPPEGFGGPQV